MTTRTMGNATASARSLYFVPEGKVDRSQARSAWKAPLKEPSRRVRSDYWNSTPRSSGQKRRGLTADFADYTDFGDWGLDVGGVEGWRVKRGFLNSSNLRNPCNLRFQIFGVYGPSRRAIWHTLAACVNLSSPCQGKPSISAATSTLRCTV
jgi:hypothetical protein